MGAIENLVPLWGWFNSDAANRIYAPYMWICRAAFEV